MTAGRNIKRRRPNYENNKVTHTEKNYIFLNLKLKIMMTLIDHLKKYADRDVSLRDYQLENKCKVYDEWQHSNSVMLQQPTGTGKTRLFASIVKDICVCSSELGSSNKILIMAHRTELVNQIAQEIGRYGLDFGIIQADTEENKECQIQVASIQTLQRRIKNWKAMAFRFIIVDEAHHITSVSYQKIVMTFPDAKVLGVTATPYRLDGEGFNGCVDKLIVSPDVSEFIEKGYLSHYDYYSIPNNSLVQYEIDKITSFEQGDYSEQELVRICDNCSIRAQVVDAYLKFASGKKGIVYTINKEHNFHLCEDFVANGITAVAINCDTPTPIRRQYLEAFRRGEILVICNVYLFTEGFDCPEIDFVQMARPTKSLSLFLQQVGRGLRISPTKEKAIFLDNVGLYNLFGLPSNPRNWYKYFYKERWEHKESQKNRKPRSKQERNLDEGNEEVRLIYTTCKSKVEESCEKPDLQQENWNLASILLLVSYL